MFTSDKYRELLHPVMTALAIRMYQYEQSGSTAYAHTCATHGSKRTRPRPHTGRRLTHRQDESDPLQAIHTTPVPCRYDIEERPAWLNDLIREAVAAETEDPPNSRPVPITANV